jgi:diamine N-acetyltransferase
MKPERVENAAQIAEVAALARAIWMPHYVPIVGAAQIEYMLGKFQSEAAIARQIAQGGYEYYLAPGAGYVALVPDVAGRTLMVSKIYVKAEFRGTGLGKAMMALAHRRAAELGCREMWLTVNRENAGSIAFYERLGFRKTGPLVQDIGEGYVMDDWRMAKDV